MMHFPLKNPNKNQTKQKAEYLENNEHMQDSKEPSSTPWVPPIFLA